MRIRSMIKRLIRWSGYEFRRIQAPASFDPLADFTADERAIIHRAQPFTMTSPERLAAMLCSVAYLTKHCIAGDFVECGVWRGGSMMAAALRLVQLGDTSRDLYLYDTFAGMT